MTATDGFGHEFVDQGLLQQALTHCSAASRNNERLEFLGDSLVNLIIAEALYTRWPKVDEGALTRARAELVRESALAGVARDLKLGPHIRFGPGELKTGAHRRDSILADALEALIAAIYLDSGFERCREVVLGWFEPILEALPVGQVDKDPKTRLQEWLQARQLALPVYQIVEASGEDHDKHFRMACVLESQSVSAEGEGNSRRVAEQQAARLVLAQLERSAAEQRERKLASRRGPASDGPSH